MLYLCYYLIFSTLYQPAIYLPNADKFRYFLILASIVSVGAFLKNNSSDRSVGIALNKYISIMFFAYIFSSAQHFYLAGTLNTTLYFAKRLLIYFCVYVYIDTPKKLKIAIWSIVLACVFQAFSSYQYLLADPTLSQFDGRLQAIGYYNLSNSFALLLTVTTPLSFILLEIEKSYLKIFFLFFFLCIFFYFCLLTKSRGGVLGITFALSFSFLLSRKIARFKMIKFSLIGIIIFLTFTIGLSLISQRSSHISLIGGDASADDRVIVWHAAFRMLIDHPIFGVGWGRFTDYVTDYGSPVRIIAHNTIISVFAELGLLGGITFLSILKYSLSQLYRIMKHSNDEINILAQGLFISLVAFLFNTLFSVKDHDPIYWAIISLTASCINIFRREQHKSSLKQPF